MKTTTHFAFGALSLALLSFALPDGAPRFAVKEQTKLAKVFDDSATFHSTAMHVTVDGNEVPQEEMGGEVKLTFEEMSHVEVTDEYVSIKDGKPAKLKRSFDKLSGKSKQEIELPEGAEADGETNETKEKASALQGKTVVFTLDESGDDYKTEFEDGKGDAALLEHLDADMDLAGFLPTKAVAEGKSWDIEAKVFDGILGTPGGDLQLKAEGEEDDEGPDMDEQFEENLKGKGTGTYKGEREVDGHRCAVIQLEGVLKTEGKQDQKGEGGHGGVMTLELEFTLEGELLWDLEAGHFRSCTVTSKIKMTMKNAMSMDFGDEKHSMEQVTEFEGEGEFKAALGG